MPGRRAELAQDMRLLDRLQELESHSHGAVWVREMLLRRSGSLVLLHQPSGTGFRLRYENVASCFHLFSLIQTATVDAYRAGEDPTQPLLPPPEADPAAGNGRGLVALQQS